MLTLSIAAIGSANLKASERRCCLERDGTNRAGMLPRKVNDLLNLITIETIVKRNGQSGGKFDTFECSNRFFTDIPQVFTAQLDNVLQAVLPLHLFYRAAGAVRPKPADMLGKRTVIDRAGSVLE